MKRLALVALAAAAVGIVACSDDPLKPRSDDPAAARPSLDITTSALTSEEACAQILRTASATSRFGPQTLTEAQIATLCASPLFRAALCEALRAAQTNCGPVNTTIVVGRFQFSISATAEQIDALCGTTCGAT